MPVPPPPAPPPERGTTTTTTPAPDLEARPEPMPDAPTKTLRLVGTVPPEVWNRLGTKILPKLRSGPDLKVGVDFSVTVSADRAGGLISELRQVLEELGLAGTVRVE